MDPRSATVGVVVLGLALLGAGVWLLKTGWWPRRRGTQRHCRTCDYILDAIEGVERCPECGTLIKDSANVLLGDRVRRPTRSLAGVMLAILGIALGAGGAGIIGAIDLYRAMPASWVIRNASSSNAQLAERAWEELDRRAGLNQLSEGHHRELTELALIEQSKAQPGPIANELDYYLISRLELAKLNEAQKAQFFRQAVRLEISVRKVVTAGDWPIYRIAHKERAMARYWFRYRELKLTVAGQKLQHIDRWREPSENWRGGWSEGWFCAPQPGEHQLELLEEIEIHRGPEGDFGRSLLAATFTTRAVAPFRSALAKQEVSSGTRPAAGFDDVEVVEDAALGAEIKRRFTMNSFTLSEKTEPSGQRKQFLKGVFTQSYLPMDLGCEVIVRTGGPGATEHRVMTLGVKAHSGSYQHTVWVDDIKLPPTKTIDLVVRAGVLPARRCPDIYKTWQGEIVFQNVAVTEATK